MPIKPIDETMLSRIKSNSVLALADEPHKNAKEMKEYLVRPIVGASDSIFHEINRIVDETNQEIMNIPENAQMLIYDETGADITDDTEIEMQLLDDAPEEEMMAMSVEAPIEEETPLEETSLPTDLVEESIPLVPYSEETTSSLPVFDGGDEVSLTPYQE